VPEGVRLREARGAQAIDVWESMRGRRQEYEDAAQVLESLDALSGVVDTAAEHERIRGWDWVSPTPPRLLDVVQLNRLLAFALFVHDADQRIRRSPGA
jgi:hypothetical protein